MNPWRQFPLVRLILPVFIGMATGIFCDMDLNVPLALPGTIFLCFGLLVFFPKFIFPYSLRWITGILIFLLTVLFSFRIMLMGKDTLNNDYFGNLRSIQRYYIGEIIEPVIQKQKSTKVIMRITWLNVPRPVARAPVTCWTRPAPCVS